MNTSDGSGSLLPGDRYPNWLTFNSDGSSVDFEIPKVNGCILKTVMCHVHYSSTDNITFDGLKYLLVMNHTMATIHLYKRDTLASFEDEEWQRLQSNLEPGNKVEVVVVFGKRLIVNKTTVYLIYEPMQICHAANKNVIVSSSDENICAINSFSPQECKKFGGGGHERGSNGGHSNVQCQICNKFGHIAASCYHRFDPNYVAKSNFHFQNQLPQQHATVQPIFLPSQGCSVPHQQQFHFTHMHSTRVQPLRQTYQIPYIQHSQFETVSSASLSPLGFPAAYIDNSGLSQVPTQQSQNWFINSGTLQDVTSSPTNLVQTEPVQGQEHVFLGKSTQGFPIQYCFHPNYVAENNFQSQNQFPQQHAYITSSGLSQAPTQQSQNGLINSGTSQHVTYPTNSLQAEPFQGNDQGFPDIAQG